MNWDEMARPWLETAPDLEHAFADIFDLLFETANLKNGAHVLDVGCGTGPTLRHAAKLVGPEGSITGIDIAPPLLAFAAHHSPSSIRLIEGDAQSYDFEAASYDAVIANFGIMFFEDTAMAAANLRKACKTGGRLTATVWGLAKDNPWFTIPRSCVDAAVANVPRPDPLGPGPTRFGKTELLDTVLTGAGWDVQIETHDVMLTPPGTPDHVADLQMLINVGTMLRDVDPSEDQLASVRNSLVSEFQSLVSNGRMRVPARIHTIQATAL